MKYNRFLPLLIPAVNFLFMEIFFFFPKMVYIYGLFMCLFIFFACRQFVIASRLEEKWYNIFIQPVVFLVGTTAFITMLPGKLWIQFLIVLNTIFLYFYFKTVYYFLLMPDKYQNYSLENLASYGNFLAIYFLASAIYGFQSFLGAPVWLLMAIFLAVIALVAYQVVWANKIDKRESFFYILLASLLLLELAWSVSFLTLSYYILGLIIAACYYVIVGLIRFHLLGSLEKRTIKYYLIFGLSSILIVLLTAKWI